MHVGFRWWIYSMSNVQGIPQEDPVSNRIQFTSRYSSRVRILNPWEKKYFNKSCYLFIFLCAALEGGFTDLHYCLLERVKAWSCLQMKWKYHIKGAFGSNFQWLGWYIFGSDYFPESPMNCKIAYCRHLWSLEKKWVRDIWYFCRFWVDCYSWLHSSVSF